MKGMDFGDLMKQAQKLTKQMNKIQGALKERVVEGSAGGGVVKVFMNGQQEVVGIKVNPDTLDPDDVEMLQDLLMVAVNQALKKSKDLAQAEMAKATGGALPPGLLGM
ncbi:MAG: YbaB/EbfC family nucleoid-associated protein [Planctomycetota bacterium]|jgi:DNA-binding YbaB/EbfC family protein